jgi:DNA-binding Lrp family transcriptional regulator
MRMAEWVIIPTIWILDKELLVLKRFRWQGPEKSGFVAALMTYIAIAHYAVSSPTGNMEEPGMATLSFSDLSRITNLSRAKVAEAIRILELHDLIKRVRVQKTNIYKITGYNPERYWAKLPAKKMYDEQLNEILPFKHFKLRQKTELNALKIFFLLVALRDRKTNHANPSYDKISEYTGVQKGEIRSALSLLVTLEMIHVDKGLSLVGPENIFNMYRVVGIENYRHRGTMNSDQTAGIDENSEQ